MRAGLMSPNATLSTLWGAWLIVWMVGALWTARTVEHQPVGPRLAHSALFAGGSLLIFFRPDALGPGIRVASAAAWGGVVLVAVGLGFAVWARVHLGRLWSGHVTLKADHAIIRSGPYGWVRHPIYTGLLLAATGTTIVGGTPGGLVGLGLLTCGVLLKIRQEEKLLGAHFGDAYRSYQTEVPALVPRFHGGPTGCLLV